MQFLPIKGDSALRLSPEVAAGNDLSIAERLADLDIPEEVAGRVVDLVEAEIDREAFHRAAVTLAEVGRMLRGSNTATTYSSAVAAALGLTDGESLRELGERHGVRKQAVANQIDTLRGIFAPAVLFNPRKRGKTKTNPTAKCPKPPLPCIH